MSWEFFRTKSVHPRKDHACQQCGTTIVAGEQCSYGAGKFEGYFLDYYEHTDCREAWNKLNFTVRDGDTSDGEAFLIDDDDISDTLAWLDENYPAVAARIRSHRRSAA